MNEWIYFSIMMVRLAVVLAWYLVIKPISWLFIWITNLLGHKGIRVVGKKLQVPVSTYKHLTSEKIVVFIATMHLAESHYFSSLQQIIDSLSDHDILFESIGSLTPEQQESLNEKEQVISEQIKEIAADVYKIRDAMELQYQREGLSYLPTWINTDLSLYEIIRLFAQNDIYPIKKGKDPRLFKNEESKELGKWLLNIALYRIVPLTYLFRFISIVLPKRRIQKKIILDERNKIAWQGISNYLRQGDKVASIWGAEHLRGIDKLLRMNGFKEIQKIWLTAYHIRDYKFPS